MTQSVDACAHLQENVDSFTFMGILPILNVEFCDLLNSLSEQLLLNCCIEFPEIFYLHSNKDTMCRCVYSQEVFVLMHIT